MKLLQKCLVALKENRKIMKLRKYLLKKKVFYGILGYKNKKIEAVELFRNNNLLKTSFYKM